MAGVEGFEPSANGFGDRCSTKLSYTPARFGGVLPRHRLGITTLTGSLPSLKRRVIVRKPTAGQRGDGSSQIHGMSNCSRVATNEPLWAQVTPSKLCNGLTKGFTAKGFTAKRFTAKRFTEGAVY